MKRRISVLIADDHEMFASAMATWLERAPDVRVVARVPDAEQAVRLAAQFLPEVVLLDVDMPGLSCFEAARIINTRTPDTCIVFVSAHTHDQYIEQALAVEAVGYVTKSEPPDAVLSAIRAGLAGEAYFSPDVQARLIVDAEGVHLTRPARTRLSLLTDRERDVLLYLARGMSKRDVAKQLSLSVKTVDSHACNLMDKLDIHDRVELTRFAIREGLIRA